MSVLVMRIVLARQKAPGCLQYLSLTENVFVLDKCQSCHSRALTVHIVIHSNSSVPLLHKNPSYLI